MLIEDKVILLTLMVLVFVFSALAAYYWPREEPPFIIFEGEQELQQMCWEGLHNQRHR
jgi:hypothetical protein